MRNMPNTFKKWLRFITNNEEVSRYEEQFDFLFLIVNTIACIIGGLWLLQNGEGAWIAFLIIEYTWALDNMRHNRE
ncbi:MAG TPA: hypothetical protein VN495_01645 [Candidatus Paceibacterota bacterium]|nr:hypothetical protein [Candidatus Paceibacterota bacterium]